MHSLGNFKLEFSKTFDIKGRRVTTVRLFNKDLVFISRGTATCSQKDMFNKDKGRRLALGEALQHSLLTKEERREIWEDYRVSMTKVSRW